MRLSLRTKTALAFILVSTLILGAGAYLVDLTLTERFLSEQRTGLLTRGRVVSAQLATFRDKPLQLQQQAASLGKQMSVRILVLDRQATVLADSAAVDQDRQVVITGLQETLAGATSTRYFFSEQDGWVMYALAPLSPEAERGAVLLVADINTTYRELAEVERRLAILAAVLILLAALAGQLLSHNLTTPLLKLTAAVQQMGRGQLSYRVHIQRSDELGALAAGFNEMAQRLERTESSRRRFFADAAHELRTPLTSIRILVEALQASAQPDPWRLQEYLADIHQELDRQQQLVENLLVLARGEDPASSQVRLVNVIDLLQDLEGQFQPLARQQSISLAVKLEASSQQALLDRDKLRMVLGNLLHNAINYTEHGQVELRWQPVLHPLPPAPGAYRVGQPTMQPGIRWWHFAVTDTGPGIAPDQLPLIFQRFYRGEPSRARSTGGAGLGLAIVEEIVTLAGGAVDVTSQPGKGTSFEIWFPVVPLDATNNDLSPN